MTEQQTEPQRREGSGQEGMLALEEWGWGVEGGVCWGRRMMPTRHECDGGDGYIPNDSSHSNPRVIHI